jgi:hypothetical protein
MRPPTWIKTAISTIGRRMIAIRMYMRVLALFPVTAYLRRAEFVETGTGNRPTPYTYALYAVQLIRARLTV